MLNTSYERLTLFFHENSEYLRKSGDEARERGVSSESERVAATKLLGELKESSLALEQSVAVSQAKVCSLQSELDSNGDKINRLESELDLESKRRVSAENAAGDASSLQTRLEALRVTHEECANALASARRELSETAAGAGGGLHESHGEGTRRENSRGAMRDAYVFAKIERRRAETSLRGATRATQPGPGTERGHPGFLSGPACVWG